MIRAPIDRVGPQCVLNDECRRWGRCGRECAGHGERSVFTVRNATIVHPTRAAYTHPLYKEHLCKVSSERPPRRTCTVSARAHHLCGTCAHSATRPVGGCIARCGGRSAYFARSSSRVRPCSGRDAGPCHTHRVARQYSACNTCRDALRAFDCAADETRITRALTGAPLRVLDNKWIRYSPAVPASTRVVPARARDQTDHCRQVLR